jgi:hypothetical protein
MENLFYSESEKTAFWIAGYCADLNTDSVMQKIKSLKGNAKKFANVIGKHVDLVSTYEVHKSSRYKSMRVFYATGVAESPKSAFQIGGLCSDGTPSDWTMTKWIHD